MQVLRNFYYRNTLGRSAQASLRKRIADIWPHAKGQTVLGFGFAVPVLRPYLKEARRVIAMMPAQQGVSAWPTNASNICFLGHESFWPIDTGQVDRLILLHALELSDRPDVLLEEAQRVLGPGGRALIIVPNRAGLWARSENTPFGSGRPYSISQIEARLSPHGFLVEQYASALYHMPTRRRLWLRAAPVFEHIGHKLSPIFAGGVLIVEVSKRYPPAKKRPSQEILDTALGLLRPKPQPKPVRSTT